MDLRMTLAACAAIAAMAAGCAVTNNPDTCYSGKAKRCPQPSTDLELAP